MAQLGSTPSQAKVTVTVLHEGVGIPKPLQTLTATNTAPGTWVGKTSGFGLVGAEPSARFGEQLQVSGSHSASRKGSSLSRMGPGRGDGLCGETMLPASPGM